MICTECGNETRIELIPETTATKDVSILQKLGRLTLICFTGGLWLLVPKTQSKSRTRTAKHAVCQTCGHSWKIK